MIRTTLLSLLIIAVVAGLAGGGLFAYFSDTETSLNNTFVAGVWSTNLKVDVDDEWYDDESPPGGVIHNTAFPLFGNLPDIKPTHHGSERVSIHFESSYDDEEDLNILLRDTDGTGPYLCQENGIIDPEQAAGDITPLVGELDQYLKLTFVLEEEYGDPGDIGDNILTPIWTGYPSDLAYDAVYDGYRIPNTPQLLDPAKSYWVRVYWYFDETIPGINVSQGDTFSFTLVFATGWIAP